MTTLETALTRIASLLREKTGVDVAIGSPAGVSDLYIWPWQISELPGRKAEGSRSSGDGSPPEYFVQMKFLLIAGRGDASVQSIALANKALYETSKLLVAENEVLVNQAPLASQELAAIFTAAGIRLVLHTSYAIQCRL